MLIASDLDHVLCDLTGQARIVLAGDLGVPVDEIIETYVYHRCLAHADPTVNARIRMDQTFWERPEILSGAQPMTGAVTAAWRLYEAGMLTSYVTRRSPITAGATYDWLRNHDLPRVPVHFVGKVDHAMSYASCKTSACRASGADLLVDDSQDEVRRVLDSGLSAILVDAPVGRRARKAFLQEHPDIICLPSMVEVVDHLIEQHLAA